MLAGKYLLQALIARGGMGRIFRAEQRPIGRQIAVKVLSFDGNEAHDPQFEQRFFLEAATLGRLKHPNTVTVFDYGFAKEEGVYYMAMELVDGENLALVVKRDGPLPVGRALRVVYEVVRALAEAHELGIVHRDLKPANIMVASGEDGDQVKVLDFGIAKVLAKDDQDLTKSEMLVGSPKFMSPEQIRHQAIDQRSDVYSLGVVLYYLVSGEEPFRGNTHIETLMAHLHKEVPPLRQAGVTVPASVEALIRKCLAKEAGDRFQTSNELKVALRRELVAFDQTVTGPTPTLSRRELEATTLPTRRRGGSVPIAAAFGVGAVLVVGALALLWMAWPRSEPVLRDASLPIAAPAPPPAAPTSIVLTITSDPPGAVVTEGGVARGVTPVAVPWVAAGEPRQFELGLDGYAPASLVQPGVDADVSRNVVLEPLPAPKSSPKAPKSKAHSGGDLLLER